MLVWEILYLLLILNNNAFLFKVIISKYMNVHNTEKLYFRQQQSNGSKIMLNTTYAIQNYINAFKIINLLMHKYILKNRYITGHQFLASIHICLILKISSYQQKNTSKNNHALKLFVIWKMTSSK